MERFLQTPTLCSAIRRCLYWHYLDCAGDLVVGIQEYVNDLTGEVEYNCMLFDSWSKTPASCKWEALQSCPPAVQRQMVARAKSVGHKYAKPSKTQEEDKEEDEDGNEF